MDNWIISLPFGVCFSLSLFSLSRWDDSFESVEPDGTPGRCGELFALIAPADNAKSPAAELDGGIPAADIAAAAAAADGGGRPASAAGWGIIGNGGPWVCADCNCWACICCWIKNTWLICIINILTFYCITIKWLTPECCCYLIDKMLLSCKLEIIKYSC